MAEPAITHQELLAALRDIRLPESAPGGLLAECFAAVGVGLILACALSMLIRLFTRPAQDVEQSSTLGDRIRQLQSAPLDERALALLHLVRSHNPDAYRDLAGDLYGSGKHLPDIAALEAALDSEAVTHV